MRPLLLSQVRTSSNFDLAFVLALYGVAETKMIAPSSTYSESEECVHLELRVSRNDVYMAERMGDRGEPWGVPSGTVKGSMSIESRRMEAERLVRNEKIHVTRFGGKPFLVKMSRVLLASM